MYTYEIILHGAMLNKKKISATNSTPNLWPLSIKCIVHTNHAPQGANLAPSDVTPSGKTDQTVPIKGVVR